MKIELNGLYLSRHGREIGIVADRGERQIWRWLTSRGYYVTKDGRASIAGGEVSEDLVLDLTPTAGEVAGADSMFGCAP
jgi:hypothetical protein